MHTTSKLVDTAVTQRDGAFRERTFHFRSHRRHASARLPARFVRPCGQRRRLSFLPSLVFFLFNYLADVLRLCVIASVDGTSVSKRPSHQAICDPSFTFGGGSVSVYIHIYMYIAICIYMYICEQMGKRGGVLISPYVFLFFSLIIFVDLSCPFIPRVSSKIFLEHPFPVLIAEIVTAVPLASPLCFSLFLFFSFPLPMAL